MLIKVRKWPRFEHLLPNIWKPNDCRRAHSLAGGLGRERSLLLTPLNTFHKNDFFGLYSPVFINHYLKSKNYASNTNQTRAKMIRTLETLT
jgi:hypothetical protein